MDIQIRPYYCPKCKSFKEWCSVIATDEFPIANYCRACGTECYDTEVLLEMMISEKATALWAGENEREAE